MVKLYTHKKSKIQKKHKKHKKHNKTHHKTKNIQSIGGDATSYERKKGPVDKYQSAYLSLVHWLTIVSPDNKTIVEQIQKFKKDTTDINNEKIIITLDNILDMYQKFKTSEEQTMFVNIITLILELSKTDKIEYTQILSDFVGKLETMIISDRIKKSNHSNNGYAGRPDKRNLPASASVIYNTVYDHYNTVNRFYKPSNTADYQGYEILSGVHSPDYNPANKRVTRSEGNRSDNNEGLGNNV
jgi:hypothetical protein